VSGILPFAPLDLVDLLLDLERLEIIELGLMRLKLRVKLVFAVLRLPTGEVVSSAVGSSPLAARRTEGGRREGGPAHYVQTKRLAHPCHQSQGSCPSSRIRRSI
jgi:hypothetical protein